MLAARFGAFARQTLWDSTAAALDLVSAPTRKLPRRPIPHNARAGGSFRGFCEPSHEFSKGFWSRPLRGAGRNPVVTARLFGVGLFSCC